MYNANEEEKKILEYWDNNNIFQKSIEERPADKPYVFYDGPPFATGLPHYGHIVGTLIKDVIPRYQTMKGYRVERVWGWDCHGLPIENIVELDLKLKNKKDIEQIGIEKFNNTCRSCVMDFAKEWEKIIHRFGRWVDMKNAYRTMDLDYMESVWWVFKQLWDKDLIYEGYKSMHVCPRCETTLSQQEVSEGYKDVKDLSVIGKFELSDEPGVCLLAWTTTPWTLPANVALAVGEDIDYVKIRYFDKKSENIDLDYQTVIIAKDIFIKWKELGSGKIHAKLWGNISKGSDLDHGNLTVISELKGSDLIGKKYKPLFDYYLEKDLPNKENLYTVVSADFVTTTDGTGIVHIAPAFGDDDMSLGKEKNLPFIQNVLMSGQFTDEVKDFAGKNVKPIEDTKTTDIEIIKYLDARGLLFIHEKYEHSYPHCWRCDTPLINYATSSWFVNVEKIKNKALKLAKDINWSPDHIKEGRFGKWLEGARDWSISRQRFWASVIPIWRCDCGELQVFGSVKDLEQASGEKVTDLHKDVVDKIEIQCIKCEKKMKRIPDVLDCWFESASMPYAQLHYPFDNKEKFESSFPAEFIAEGVDQTRAWFYYTHIIATALKDSKAFKNVIVNGIVLAEDGKKMAKKLKNYPEPSIVLEKYGADAMRYYLATSSVIEAENFNFTEAGVREMYNKLVNTLWNVFEFYGMYAEKGNINFKESTNILDRWILARLKKVVDEVTDNMDQYHLPAASRPILDFITDLSQWFVRRSRDRFKIGDKIDKQFAVATLREVLIVLSKILAPFTPFMAEKIYLDLDSSKESVHLEDWPKISDDLKDDELLNQMNVARKIVEFGLAARAEAKIKVRQPLQKISYNAEQLSKDLEDIIAAELNVKEVQYLKNISENKECIIKEDSVLKVGLDIKIDDDLKKEGIAREIIRFINAKRKSIKLTFQDVIELVYYTDDEFLKDVFIKFEDELKSHILAEQISYNDKNYFDDDIEPVEINGSKLFFKVALKK